MSSQLPAENFPGNFAGSLNQGSFRALARKTAEGLLNRFGGSIDLQLKATGSEGDWDATMDLAQHLLEAMVPVVAAALFEAQGFDVPDPDTMQRGAPTFEAS